MLDFLCSAAGDSSGEISRAECGKRKWGEVFFATEAVPTNPPLKELVCLVCVGKEFFEWRVWDRWKMPAGRLNPASYIMGFGRSREIAGVWSGRSGKGRRF